MNWKKSFPKTNIYYETENGILYYGDNVEIMNKFQDETVDFVFTSPPYAGINKYKNVYVPDIKNYSNWFLKRAKEISRITKKTGSFILNLGDKKENKERTLYPFENSFKITNETNLKLFELLIWNKLHANPIQNNFYNIHEYLFVYVKDLNNFIFNIDSMRLQYKSSSINRFKTNFKDRFLRTAENQNTQKKKKVKANPLGGVPKTIINISSETQKISNQHFAVFPEKLVKYFVKGFSNDDSVILDPFMGAGTTAVACEKLNRKWIGIEINKDYCKEIKNRIENEELQLELF